MAKSLNNCQFIGNLGKDPETRYLASGDAVTSFSIAVADGYKDKQTGEQVDKTEWVRVTAFGKLAEICGEYLRKGSKVYVQGRMKTHKYDKNGVTHYATEITLENMQMLDGKPQGEQQQRSSASRPVSDVPNEFEQFDDDIPF
jgi:single-strand DNA-binding protein